MAPIYSDVLKPVSSKESRAVGLHNESLTVILPSGIMRSPLYVPRTTEVGESSSLLRL